MNRSALPVWFDQTEFDWEVRICRLGPSIILMLPSSTVCHQTATKLLLGQYYVARSQPRLLRCYWVNMATLPCSVSNCWLNRAALLLNRSTLLRHKVNHGDLDQCDNHNCLIFSKKCYYCYNFGIFAAVGGWKRQRGLPRFIQSYQRHRTCSYYLNLLIR